MIAHVLKKKAKQSACKYKVAAIGFDARGNPVATRTNTPYLDKHGGSYHAEARLMSKYKRIKTIIICRVSRRGEFKPIDPCPHCARMAKRQGVTIKSLEY